MRVLSQTFGYAVRALACLSHCGPRYHRARAIAACTGVPLPYLSQVLHSLGKKGLVETKRGYRGGFALTRPAQELSLLDIARAIEPRLAEPHCLLGLGRCTPERACPAHDFWVRERKRIEDHLTSLSLYRAAEGLEGTATVAGVTSSIERREP